MGGVGRSRGRAGGAAGATAAPASAALPTTTESRTVALGALGAHDHGYEATTAVSASHLFMPPWDTYPWPEFLLPCVTL
jgi:hypothetical protein